MLITDIVAAPASVTRSPPLSVVYPHGSLDGVIADWLLRIGTVESNNSASDAAVVNVAVCYRLIYNRLATGRVC